MRHIVEIISFEYECLFCELIFQKLLFKKISIISTKIAENRHYSHFVCGI